jgi:hypothetical protein
MSNNFVDEYLVRLGASVDQSGLSRFHQALHDTASVTDRTAFGMAQAIFKAQTEIVGGFVAMGTAAVGLVDKVAMADQEYRLFALHMYMTKDAARGLKVAMDALGQPLENLAWDTELRERTKRLLEDQRGMAPSGDFEAQMRKIRDARFEFTRMEVELQYLGMHVAQDFLKALGMGPDDLLKRLRTFNDWVVHDMPAISQKIVTLFMPVWEQIKAVLSDTADVLKDASIDFNALIGTLSGDDSIDKTTASVDSLAKSLAHVVFWLGEAARLVAGLEKVALNTAVVILNIGKALAHANPISPLFWKDLSEGKNPYAIAGDSLTAAADASVRVARGFDTIGGTLLPSDFGGDKFEGGRGVVAPGVANTAGSAIQLLRSLVGSGVGQYDVPLRLAEALAMTESGARQTDAQGNVVKSSAGALGIMQLMPSTARSLGVDPTNAAQNVAGGLALLKHLLDKYGDAPTAVAAYHEGEPKMNAILAGRASLSSEARAEVAAVMQRIGMTGDVHVGSIVVHVNKPGATNSDVADVLVARLRAAQNKRTQRNLAEAQGMSWSY